MDYDTARSKITRRRSLITVAVAGGATAALLAGLLLAGGGASDAGPLETITDHVTLRIVGFDLHDDMTFALPEVDNPASMSVTLERVDLVHADGLHMLGAEVGVRHGAATTHFDAFPPSGPLLADSVGPLAGYEVPPNTEDVVIYVGIEPLRAGPSMFDALRLYYRAGRGHYVIELPFTLKLVSRERASAGSHFRHGVRSGTVELVHLDGARLAFS